MSWADTIVADQFVGQHSSVESDRFGLSMSRAVVPLGADSNQAWGQAQAFVADSPDDVVVLRYPADRVGWFAALRATGRDLVFADTLMYWRLPVSATHDAPSLGGGLIVTHGQTVIPDVVDAFVDEVFADYGNHYAADPLLDAQLALDGYRDWARRSVAGDGVVALSLDDQVVGLATTESRGTTCEILLAGVLPSHQRRGLYAGLLQGCEQRAVAVAADELVISTQGHNAQVQRAWARYGFEPVAGFITLHAVRPGLLNQR